MIPPIPRRSLTALFITTLLFVVPASAKNSDWKDTQGNSFKAEPIEALGPFAVFRTSAKGGKPLPWRFLSPADCVRFYEQVKNVAPRANTWAAATGEFAKEIGTNAKSLVGDDLVAPDLTKRPEPALLILFFAYEGESKSWDTLGKSIAPYEEMQRKFPGQMEAVFCGFGHNAANHVKMARHMKLPWLIADFYEQSRISVLTQLMPGRSEYSVIVVNREGVPLLAADNPTEEELAKLLTRTSDMLTLLKAETTRSWPDRAHYLQAIQPVIHANDHGDPVLVGNPLVAEGLRQRKVERVAASIEVAADGTVKSVTIQENTGVPTPLIAPLADALKKTCVFVPAVEKGQFVDGTYHYLLEVSR